MNARKQENMTQEEKDRMVEETDEGEREKKDAIKMMNGRRRRRGKRRRSKRRGGEIKYEDGGKKE